MNTVTAVAVAAEAAAYRAGSALWPADKATRVDTDAISIPPRNCDNASSRRLVKPRFYGDARGASILSRAVRDRPH
ncbi:hypothetical protein GWI33_017409 [Rhynchophorus ferrugineus]|uniref:Uncharacterized protein n=1 Tax=Rhynchophorus ferrugineus TaxID=354439 RepID=A0A834IRE6_RHYFE|nr:hypothetical protein GWI33_017409 [Rhynchophorus ferrugineus]